MSLAESAVLLSLHSVRMSLLILGHVVVTLFAFCTCQCDLCAHDFHLHLNSNFFRLLLMLLSIKKDLALPFARLLYHKTLDSSIFCFEISRWKIYLLKSMHEEKFLVPPKVTGNFSSCILFGSFQRNKKWNKKIFPWTCFPGLYICVLTHSAPKASGQLGQLELLEAKGNADDGHAEQKAYQSVLQSQRKP